MKVKTRSGFELRFRQNSLEMVLIETTGYAKLLERELEERNI